MEHIKAHAARIIALYQTWMRDHPEPLSVDPESIEERAHWSHWDHLAQTAWGQLWDEAGFFSFPHRVTISQHVSRPCRLIQTRGEMLANPRSIQPIKGPFYRTPGGAPVRVMDAMNAWSWSMATAQPGIKRLGWVPVVSRDPLHDLEKALDPQRFQALDLFQEDLFQELPPGSWHIFHPMPLILQNERTTFEPSTPLQALWYDLQQYVFWRHPTYVFEPLKQFSMEGALSAHERVQRLLRKTDTGE